jgi:hypothetical protein
MGVRSCALVPSDPSRPAAFFSSELPLACRNFRLPWNFYVPSDRPLLGIDFNSPELLIMDRNFRPVLSAYIYPVNRFQTLTFFTAAPHSSLHICEAIWGFDRGISRPRGALESSSFGDSGSLSGFDFKSFHHESWYKNDVLARSLYLGLISSIPLATFRP